MTWAWSVGDGNEPTLVTFELTLDGSGTRLSLTHAGEIDPVIGDLLTRGWPGRLAVLRRTLD